NENEVANNAPGSEGTGNIDTPLQVQDNQLPEGQILASTAPGDEKLIDESDIVYNRDDIIHVDCISEVYKTFKLIKGDYGLPLLEVLWKLSYTIDNSDTFSKRGVEVYELNYDWLYSLSQKPGSLYKLKADFGSGHISVFIKCIPPTVEPIAI